MCSLVEILGQSRLLVKTQTHDTHRNYRKPVKLTTANNLEFVVHKHGMTNAEHTITPMEGLVNRGITQLNMYFNGLTNLQS